MNDRTAREQQREEAGSIWRAAAVGLAVLALLGAAPRAGAQQLALSTYTDWIWVDQEFRDPDRHVSRSRFVPRMDLSLTGPFRPGSHLYLDLAGSASEDVSPLGRIGTGDVRLTLRGEEPRYQFSLLHGRSRYGSSVEGLAKGAFRLDSDTRQTALMVAVREPAWPLVTVQWQRFDSTSSLPETTSTTKSTMSRLTARYDLRPLRFAFDGNRYQSDGADGSTSEASSRRLGVALDTALRPGLNLSANMQYDRLESRFGSSPTSGSTNRLARVGVTASPTRKVALEAEARSEVNNSLLEDQGNDYTAHGSSLSLRSEVLPGLHLNVSREADRVTRAGQPVTETSTRADLYARLDDRNSLTLSFSPSRLSAGTAEPVQLALSRASWTSRLDARTDLTASVARLTGKEGATTSTTDTSYLTLRYRPDVQTSLGLSLLSSKTTRADGSGETSQSVKALGAECSWLPTRDLSLGFRLDLTRLGGASSSSITVPAFDLHWRPDSRTDLTVNWRVQHARDVVRGVANGLDSDSQAVRFRYQLSPSSFLSLDYRLLQASDGPLASERALRLGVTTNVK